MWGYASCVQTPNKMISNFIFWNLILDLQVHVHVHSAVFPVQTHSLFEICNIKSKLWEYFKLYASVMKYWLVLAVEYLHVRWINLPVGVASTRSTIYIPCMTEIYRFTIDTVELSFHSWLKGYNNLFWFFPRYSQTWMHVRILYYNL